MTVNTENCYRELLWTGAETSFAPGFSALNEGSVKLAYINHLGLPVPLSRGVHYQVPLGSGGAVTVTPIALPEASAAAPVLLLCWRDTEAQQPVAFQNLFAYDPSVHEQLHDRAMMIAAELKSAISRNITPFATTDGFVSFGARRVKVADPVEGNDAATKQWVLTVTDIINLENYVSQCAKASVEARASVSDAQVQRGGAEQARDASRSWSMTAENTPVSGDDFSAYHWARKAAAAALQVQQYQAELANPDMGDDDLEGMIGDSIDFGDDG